MGDMRLLFNYYLKSPILNDYAFIGGVESYEGNNIAQSLQIAKAKFYFFDKLNNVEVSELGKESIKRLFRLSEELNIKVSVITTPMHPYFNSLIPNMIQEEFDQLITDLLITFPDVDYFDLSSFQLQNNDFLDGDHLNSNGASKFTEKITSLGLFDAP
jgi:lysophospholipase L1-like esterase